MTHAIVLIEAERDAISTLGGALADIAGVAEAYSVTGEWDFVAMLRVRNPEEVAEVVTGRFGVEGARGRPRVGAGFPDLVRVDAHRVPQL